MPSTSGPSTGLLPPKESEASPIDWGVLADQQVTALRSALRSGAQDLDVIPKLLKTLLTGDLWQRRFVEQAGKEVAFERFAEFVQTPAPDGLGTTVETLKKFCQSAGDVEAVDLIVRAAKGKHGGDRSKINIVNLDKPMGNTSARALIDLKAKRPDLHQRVIARETTPHAAMVEAGLRIKTHTIPHDVIRAAAAIRRQFTAEEVAEIARRLTE